jgi:hypothetical protein
MDSRSPADPQLGDLGRLGAALGTLADLREAETLSLCREVMEAAFADSIGHAVISALLRSPRPIRLIDLAVQCGRGRRSILPNGEIRVVVDRLIETSAVVIAGGPGRPRYSLNRGERHAEVLSRMYNTVRYETAGRIPERRTGGSPDVW